MESGSSLLAESLRERISPVLLLLPTPAVEESCRKNNLTFLQLMRPFCHVDRIDVPVRTASDQPFRLQEFWLRMFYASDLSQPSVESSEECLLRVVNNASDEALAEIQGDPTNLEVIKKMVQSESLSSWFQKYSKTLIHSLAFSDHETFDHPIACLRAVSSRDDNPIHKFVELYESDPMPALLSDGTMDPKLLKIYLLIHDLQDGPADRANEVLSEMRATFGFNDCWLLCINSGEVSENDTVQDEFWKSQFYPLTAVNSSKDVTLSSEIKLGGLLSEDDVNEIAELMVQICSKSILPYMEQKIRSLNQQVIATRKGLKNQIKNLWWRKGKEEVADTGSNIMYTFSSIESQIRVLSDYAFMLRDYELALSNYRLISSDYKADKAWKHYAGAQEMIGLSLFMLDQFRKEADLCMDTAFSTYQKLVPYGQRYSTRCAIWWAEMNKARGQYKDAAAVFCRSGTDEPHLRAGILLEQAAYCYLRATPSMLRKYGFYLVLAANRYNVCGQKKHALRAYMSVLTVFEGQGWNYINDHVIFHLGRLSTHVGDHAAAVHYFKKLISCSHQSKSNQSAFLREFLTAVQNAGQDNVKMLPLDLPSINKENIRVNFEDQRTYASKAAAALPDAIWDTIEAGIVPTARVNTGNWLYGPATTQSVTDDTDFNHCIAGETLTLNVEFLNPLQVPLNLTSVSILSTFSSENVASQEGESASSNLRRASEVPELISDEGNLDLDAHSNPSITITEESFTLKEGEKYVASLKIIPHEQGVLKILGVRWTLSGVAKGYKLFLPGTTKPKFRKARRNKSNILPPHRRLNFIVHQHMPRLEVSFHGLPDRVNSGELHRIVLELQNTSNVAIKNLRFCTSEPRMFCVGNIEDLDVEFPNCLESNTMRELQRDGELFSDDSAISSVYTFPQKSSLEGGSTLLWPLWLHARGSGTLQLNSVLYYEANESNGIEFRTVRISHVLQVSPSLEISVHISPRVLQLNQYLLRLDIANKHSKDSFWLRQVSCIGTRWRIAPIPPPIQECSDTFTTDTDSILHRDAAFLSASLSPSQLLPASQTLSLFFQLLETDLESEESLGSYQHIVSNVRLGTPSSNEPLINVTTGSIYKFHAHERALRKKEENSNPTGDVMKIMESKIDVILISEQQDVSASRKVAALAEGQRLATHHVCGCSVKRSCPVVWLMEGPTNLTHDFTVNPFCKVLFYLTIKNSSERPARVNVDMGHDTSKQSHHTQQGWHSISLESSSTQTKEMDGENTVEDIGTASPFIWSSLNRFKIDRLDSGATETYPLELHVFAPGVYDLSGYHVSWELLYDLSESADPLSKPEVVKKSPTPTTFASSFFETDGNSEIKELNTVIANDAPPVEKVAGSGCGQTLILIVEHNK